MTFLPPRPRSPRRGVTLVEMLVVVALLVLMMTILVTIFSAATGAVSGLQTYQQLDGDLRQLDITIRQDLRGVTCNMTPPVDRQKNLGYFEIGENAFADLQQEDTDDYIRFTAKAPEGKPFTGRMWLSPLPNASNQPVLITSQYAEIIYFLRNGNLYRRVLLVAPEKQAAVNTVYASIFTPTPGGFGTSFQPASLGNLVVSWQGMNDLSARPSTSGNASAHPIVLNTLGDLTNRENRFAYSRFANDYVNNIDPTQGPDGVPDDENLDNSTTPIPQGDGVPDYYCTLYYQVLTASPALLGPTAPMTRAYESLDTMAFPYVFPGAYSKPDVYNGSTSGAGWIHSTDPRTTFTNELDQLTKINHSPLSSGETLMFPPQETQTWWGFPTWRETMLPQWNDPYWILYGDPTRPATRGTQPLCLHPILATVIPTFSMANPNCLPPLTPAYRATPQDYNDGSGSDLFTAPSASAATIATWRACWDDDLIMTGVRSFDIKVLDNSYAGYVDLGWGNDLRLQPATDATGFLSQGIGRQFLTGTPVTFGWRTRPGLAYNTLNETFAHEGRMPPLTTDERYDAQFGPAIYLPPYSAYTGNIGDNQAGIVRLRRVWDSWSTDYTRAPARGYDPRTYLPIGPPPDSIYPQAATVIGAPYSPPIYPSYPPPYPAPMRGIQIQIRVTDPKNERVKVLTIRQDFTDKL